MNNLIEIKIKYNHLQNEYNKLLNKSNNINYNSVNEEEEEYQQYLVEENKRLKKINSKYEIILDYLISYINDINIFYETKQIEYFKLKQNITNNIINDEDKDNYINNLSEFLNKCKEKIIYKKINVMKNENKKNTNNINIRNNNIKIKNKIKNKNNSIKKILNYKSKNNNKNRSKRNLSVKNTRNKYINSSCDSLNSIINKSSIKTSLKNSCIKKNKKISNLFKKKKPKNKDKIWNNNKLVYYY